MLSGTVHFFDSSKGYGFITPDEGGDDVFVHFTGIREHGLRELSEGQRVSYLTVEGKKGKPQAVNVTLQAKN